MTNLHHIVIKSRVSILYINLFVCGWASDVRTLKIACFFSLLVCHSFFIYRWHCFPILSYPLSNILSENN